MHLLLFAEFRSSKTNHQL